LAAELVIPVREDVDMASSEMIMWRTGRRVAVHRVADGSGGRTVVLCHPAPGSGDFDPDPEATAARGVTLLGVDRPGYGDSGPVPPGQWASVDGAADDLAEVLDTLGAGRVGVAGWSAGGRVALALAARRPDLVDRVAVIATPAPDEQVPWIPPDYKAGLEKLRGLPPEQVHEILGEQLAGLLAAGDPESALAMISAGGPDEPVLGLPGVRHRLGAMLAASLRQGPTGLASDIAGYSLRPWGFDPGQVKAKTLLVYGARDPATGPRHGKWYQQHLPQARYEQAPDAGHLVVIPLWPRVLSHLAPRSRR
jgi:pimeloyl-ACP methyl ester carboxylesterase